MRPLLVLLAFLVLAASLPSYGQELNAAHAKKIKAYKTAFTPAALKEGLHGLQAVFSCEYFFSDPEYAELTDAQGKTLFVFYLQLFNERQEPVYYPFQYPGFSSALSRTAVHFATENAYAPQVSTQGRRNTGISLFIPFAHLDLPEGNHTLTLTLNAYSPKTGKRYENFFTTTLTLNKPPSYWVSLQPSKLTIFRKNGAQLAARQLEEDISLLRGSNLRYPELAGSGNAELGKSVAVILSEGDVCYVRLHKNRENTARAASFVVPVLSDVQGKRILSFDNPPAGDFLLDLSKKEAALRNSSFEGSFVLSRQRIPPLILSYPRIKPYLVQDGLTGMSLSFDYEAPFPPALPSLYIRPSYRSQEQAPALPLRGGERLSGNVEIDSSGGLTLPPGKGSVVLFYPFANLLYFDPDIILHPPRLTVLEAGLAGGSGSITRKQASQGFNVTVLRNASLESVVWANDTLIAGEHGLAFHLPTRFPANYFKLPEAELALRLIPTASDDKGRFVNLFKRLLPLNEGFKRLYFDTTTVKSISYTLLRPNPSLDFFLPYTSLGQFPPEEGLPFVARFLLAPRRPKPVELGSNESLLRFRYPRQNLRLLTVGINKVVFKKAANRVLRWQIRAQKRLIYLSPPIAVDNGREVSNFYAQYYSSHQDDSLRVEVLEGEAVVFSWQIPVKALSGEQVLRFEAGKSESIKSPTLSSVELKYIAN